MAFCKHFRSSHNILNEKLQHLGTVLYDKVLNIFLQDLNRSSKLYEQQHYWFVKCFSYVQNLFILIAIIIFIQYLRIMYRKRLLLKQVYATCLNEMKVTWNGYVYHLSMQQRKDSQKKLILNFCIAKFLQLNSKAKSSLTVRTD